MTMQPTGSLGSFVRDLNAQVKDLASEVHLAELQSAVRKKDGPSVTHWATLCSEYGTIDRRLGSHSIGGLFALSAPPLWLAVYRGDLVCAKSLLEHGADPNAVAVCCPGRAGCSVGGQSPLHLATSRGSSDCVHRLLRGGASVEPPLCFAVSAVDEPEWEETTGTFDGGLAGLSALQLASLRAGNSPELCALLLAHGADSTALARLPAAFGGESAPAAALRVVLDEEGAPLECPICLQEVVQLTCEWTPCCLRVFHRHCLRRTATCPMCRHPLDQARGGGAEPPGDRELARSLAQEERQWASRELDDFAPPDPEDPDT